MWGQFRRLNNSESGKRSKLSHTGIRQVLSHSVYFLSFKYQIMANIFFRIIFSFLIVMLLLLLLMNDKVALGQDGDPVGSTQGGGGREMVPALFIFGDSLIDNGNNNNLPSFAKANYYPYGIDFNGGPTGRFSNGYTMVDEIAELLGLPLIPAYSEASGAQVLHGVNYASAAAGILDITGRNF
ncbi:hypothetical protein CICLE_v100203322mg, partial [Citrus x clementina]